MTLQDNPDDLASNTDVMFSTTRPISKTQDESDEFNLDMGTDPRKVYVK